MTTLNPILTEFTYKNKNIFLRFADSINKKSVYPLFQGRKIVFITNRHNHPDYKISRFKYRYLAVFFFIITMPLLALTMSIKAISHENKLKFREVKKIKAEKKERKEKRKKALEDAKLKKKKKEEQDLLNKKLLHEAIKRVESPSISFPTKTANDEELKPDIVIDLAFNNEDFEDSSDQDPIEGDIESQINFKHVIDDCDCESDKKNQAKIWESLTSSPTFMRIANYAKSFWKGQSDIIVH